MLSVIFIECMPSVMYDECRMLIVIMLNFIMLSVIMLNVVAPLKMILSNVISSFSFINDPKHNNL
jgi:hypothetical protein